MGKTLPRVAERFIKYAKYDTQSAYLSESYPSTLKQLALAKDLAKELEEIGMKDASVNEYGYVCATLPANVEGDIPRIGFSAHYDTTPEMDGKDVKPQIIENYDGNDIVLNKEKNIVLSTAESPELKKYVGKTLITSDGTTLLGVDDKAGIAEIITAVEYLINHPEIPHGTVKVAFTPDEEVGRGVLHFDIEKFDVDFAYTLDGGPIGELVYETFNGATAKVAVNGKNVHPGLAKNKMLNAIDAIAEFNAMLPVSQRPQYTENREGYFHVFTINGDVEKCCESIYIRDHDREKFEGRKELVMQAARFINEKYGNDTVQIALEDMYYNMGDVLKDVMHIVDTMEEATKAAGITPYFKAMRGGTDGAWLTHRGLPTPNIFTGGHNYHGRYEYVPVQSMEKATEVVVRIVELYAKRASAGKASK